MTQNLPAGMGGYKTRHSVPSILFFNKIHYRYQLNRYTNNFRHVQEPYLARIGLSSSFFTPADMACIPHT